MLSDKLNMCRLKRSFLLLIIVLIVIGVCGCMDNVGKNSAEQMKEMALEYLNDNYSDTFAAKVFTASNWAYEYESITFASKKYHDAIVEVRAYKNDDGTYRFKDNYYHCYMMDSAVNYGKALLAKDNAVVKVRFANTVWSDELAGAETFDEWKDHGSARADFFMIAGNALSADDQTEIVEKIANDKVCGYVTFIVTEDENLLQDVSLDEILNNQSKYVVSENKYFVNRQFEVCRE